eukprot:c18779_g1_i1 orf=313-507(-)
MSSSRGGMKALSFLLKNLPNIELLITKHHWLLHDAVPLNAVCSYVRAVVGLLIAPRAAHASLDT